MRQGPWLETPPDSALCCAVTEFARHVSPCSLFNHVQRTYRFAALLGSGLGSGTGSGRAAHCDPEVLYIGSVLHDLGLTDAVPIETDFEIDGADAARRFLLERGANETTAELVWQAIALHTTPGGLAAKSVEAMLVQAGAAVDIGIIPLSEIPQHFLEEVMERWPREGFKELMIELLVERVRKTPAATAKLNVSRLVGRPMPCSRHLGLCDVIRRSAFSS